MTAQRSRVAVLYGCDSSALLKDEEKRIDGGMV